MDIAEFDKAFEVSLDLPLVDVHHADELLHRLGIVPADHSVVMHPLEELVLVDGSHLCQSSLVQEL
jgi:hypothetical protein